MTPTRWSFNVTEIAANLAPNGCKLAGVTASRIVGVARPTGNNALWVVQTQHCGAGSCAGVGANVFLFSPEFARINPATGYYYSGAVREEISQFLGVGGIRFRFPRLTLYVNNGYHECPSHWTRMIYEWTRIEYEEKFILANAIAYTSRQCVFKNTQWPPDPGR